MNTAVARDRNGRTLLVLVLIIAGMVILVALTPRLYRAFCEATGFDGTTQRADRAPGAVAGQVKVQFDANVHPGLPWRFEPEQVAVNVAPGAQTKIFYSAQNLSARAITGQAVYNVSPDTVGKYFKKIQCFCFSEQTLQPGRRSTCRWSSSSIRRSGKIRTRKTSTKSRSATHFILWKLSQPLARATAKDKEGSARTWPRRRTMITTW